jgi:hypothetical protein
LGDGPRSPAALMRGTAVAPAPRFRRSHSRLEEHPSVLLPNARWRRAPRSPKLIDRRSSPANLSLWAFPERSRHTAANEADRVAWCESSVRSKRCRLRRPLRQHPASNVTGYRYTAAGLFQIIRTHGRRLRARGVTQPRSRTPVANIRGAAILWEWGWSRGRDPWTPWVCKPGSDCRAHGPPPNARPTRHCASMWRAQAS